MVGEVDGYDERSRLRISDADRHQVAEVLRQAAGEGRLDLEELDQRLEAAYAAKVYADLVPLVSDLPGQAPARPQAAAPARTGHQGGQRFESSIAVMGNQSRKGLWEIGPSHTAVSLMGGVQLDLRAAVFTSPEVVINASAVMGSVDVIVDAHTRVLVDGVGIMGSFDQGRDRVPPEIDASSPLVRVRGIALMGSVVVTRRGEPRRGRRRGLPPG